jgi:hypothetical protein
MAARGIRNNNPGNIRKSAEQWKGLSDAQLDSAFFQFTDMVYGIRAIAVILKTYRTRYGLDTVRKLISRWAPPNENATDSYVDHVASVVGVSPDTPINVFSWDVLAKLVRGIVTQENGAEAATITDDQIKQGVSLS